jgi:uncharacterized protein
VIVYLADKSAFRRDVLDGGIDEIIHERVRERIGHGVALNEVRSWRESLERMSSVLEDPEIPHDVGVGVEYQVPQTSKRIDFFLSGQSEDLGRSAVVIELKQWEAAEATELDGLVRTVIGGGPRETAHPSYQAWSYVKLLEGFNDAVHGGEIVLHPCAFLHNFDDLAGLRTPFYSRWVDEAPLFGKRDRELLRSFIKKWIRFGDRGETLVRIERGRIRPSKSLADSLASMLGGNPEFTMIDEQKVVFEKALALVRDTPPEEKRVLLVHGGPGTGKSVVAVNLLVSIIGDERMAQYVTKNAAPRAVYEGMLTGSMTKSAYSNLFRGSGAFTTAETGAFRALIVDEAHRLNEKSGLYRNLGENQVRELMNAADVSVFFLDEDQRVTLDDIGTREEILRWAEHFGAGVEELELESQFRCNGSDGYLAWLDHILGIRQTANVKLSSLEFDYDFRVLDSPNDVRTLIEERDGDGRRSRMVAGYCWDWASKKDPAAWDVVIPEHDFRMRWNLQKHGSGWLAHPDSLSEIGCIHTAQGLELDYVGVIIGEDSGGPGWAARYPTRRTLTSRPVGLGMEKAGEG